LLESVALHVKHFMACSCVAKDPGVYNP
jgi:hypothetical protein